MKISKKLFSILIAVALVLTIIPIGALAASSPTSGTCGNGLTWNLDSARTLTISGNGGMEDYNDYIDQPWYSFSNSVKKIIIDSGVASISQNAFKYLYKYPATNAPTIGPTINTHTCFNATPPIITAGAKLLAGLTEVPVNGIPMIWTNARVKPITIPATTLVFSALISIPE